ncbi:MAG: hypothetical protein BGO67_08610 [Alphaproteobacteria bacterium 41-28]|nr:MAG: hypothetical protein BGO67_08610 [Alphaproteobacteria bacterium 41-28]
MKQFLLTAVLLLGISQILMEGTKADAECPKNLTLEDINAIITNKSDYSTVLHGVKLTFDNKFNSELEENYRITLDSKITGESYHVFSQGGCTFEIVHNKSLADPVTTVHKIKLITTNP